LNNQKNFWVDVMSKWISSKYLLGMLCSYVYEDIVIKYSIWK